VLGPQPGGGTDGYYTYAVDVGGMEADFFGFARAQPTITAVENAASLNTAAPVASDPTSRFWARVCAISPIKLILRGCRCRSTDVCQLRRALGQHQRARASELLQPEPDQRAVPWELAGQKAAQMKVTINFTYGNVFTVPIALLLAGVFRDRSGRGCGRD